MPSKRYEHVIGETGDPGFSKELNDIRKELEGIRIRQSELGSVVDWGYADGSTTTTLFDTNKSWQTNMWEGHIIAIVEGEGRGQSRVISSNGSNYIETDQNWDTIPNTNSRYAILPPKVNSWNALKSRGWKEDTRCMFTISSVGNTEKEAQISEMLKGNQYIIYQMETYFAAGWATVGAASYFGLKSNSSEGTADKSTVFGKKSYKIGSILGYAQPGNGNLGTYLDTKPNYIVKDTANNGSDVEVYLWYFYR